MGPMKQAMARSECLDENALVVLFDGAEQDAAVHAHLDVCPDCRRVVAELARELAAEEEAGFARRDDEALTAEDFDRSSAWCGAIVGGRYRLQRCLGEGGLGIVWSATSVMGSDREAFALKFLKAPDPARAKRFVREGRVTAALRHPNIVHVYDAFEADGFPPVIVMDLLRGETLRTCMRRLGPLAIERTVAVLRAIVSALGAAHAQGVVHRDLKPDNVFLSEAHPAPSAQTVKVLDFGLAKLTALEGGCAATSPLTHSGHIVGTPTYMAPEQIYGEKDIDARADIWSLGVLAFECLSGTRPIEGRTLGHAIRAISTGKLISLAKVAPAVPAAMTNLVTRMLSVDRARRPTLDEIDAVLAATARRGGGSVGLG